MHTDVCSIDELEQVINWTIETYDKIDIYWYNAGAIIPSHIDLFNGADFDKQMAINLKGVLFCTKFAIKKYMFNIVGCNQASFFKLITTHLLLNNWSKK